VSLFSVSEYEQQRRGERESRSPFILASSLEKLICRGTQILRSFTHNLSLTARLFCLFCVGRVPIGQRQQQVCVMQSASYLFSRVTLQVMGEFASERGIASSISDTLIAISNLALSESEMPL
jgi:hypothetical protein